MSTLFVSDLDGTLLNADGMLSASSRRGLLELLARDVAFTVASARSVVSMQTVLGPLPLSLPVVGFNGGFVSDLGSGRHHKVFPIDVDDARHAFEIAAAHGQRAIVSRHSAAGDRLYVSDEHNQGVALFVSSRRRHRDPRLRVVPDPCVGLEASVMCLTVIARRSELEPIADAWRDTLPAAMQITLMEDLHTLGWIWLTAHGPEATKGRAVSALMTEHGFDNHRLVAFGDQLNDLSLFDRADHAVATANAHPDVKAAADEVIGPHHEDAVIEWLLRSRPR